MDSRLVFILFCAIFIVGIPTPARAAALSGISGRSSLELCESDLRRCLNRYRRQESDLKKQHERRGSITVASDAQQIEERTEICGFTVAYIHCLDTAKQLRCSGHTALVDAVISQTWAVLGSHCEEWSYGSLKPSLEAA